MGRRAAACSTLLLLIAISLGQFTASILAEAAAQYLAPAAVIAATGAFAAAAGMGLVVTRPVGG
jgi:hypothetical protein